MIDICSCHSYLLSKVTRHGNLNAIAFYVEIEPLLNKLLYEGEGHVYIMMIPPGKEACLAWFVHRGAYGHGSTFSRGLASLASYNLSRLKQEAANPQGEFPCR